MSQWVNEKAVGEEEGCVASHERSEGGSNAQLDLAALTQVSGSL